MCLHCQPTVGVCVYVHVCFCVLSRFYLYTFLLLILPPFLLIYYPNQTHISYCHVRQSTRPFKFRRMFCSCCDHPYVVPTNYLLINSPFPQCLLAQVGLRLLWFQTGPHVHPLRHQFPLRVPHEPSPVLNNLLIYH